MKATVFNRYHCAIKYDWNVEYLDADRNAIRTESNLPSTHPLTYEAENDEVTIQSSKLNGVDRVKVTVTAINCAGKRSRPATGIIRVWGW